MGAAWQRPRSGLEDSRRDAHPGHRADIDGEEVRRPYSICTTPQSGQLGVGIKHVEGGRFSGHALTGLSVGDRIDVRFPEAKVGNFYVQFSIKSRKLFISLFCCY